MHVNIALTADFGPLFKFKRPEYDTSFLFVNIVSLSLHWNSPCKFTFHELEGKKDSIYQCMRKMNIYIFTLAPSTCSTVPGEVSCKKSSSVFSPCIHPDCFFVVIVDMRGKWSVQLVASRCVDSQTRRGRNKLLYQLFIYLASLQRALSQSFSSPQS